MVPARSDEEAYDELETLDGPEVRRGGTVLHTKFSIKVRIQFEKS